ncbi:MAG: chitobiase/beta-hexosaminidase C-terminal domain-containing protein, partial [Acidobacteria bacterium]|nr:chitobiase/beta-hexosaminidase C-terminal domain-containing protein [Acidobacteriota bacterium]
MLVVLGAIGMAELVRYSARLYAQSSPLLRIDLLWQHQIQGWLTLWEMNGSERTSAISLSPDLVSDVNWKIRGSGDFDADGQPDIVRHHQTDGRVAVWFMSGYVQRSGVPLGPGVVSDLNWKLRTVGDLNNDGHPDLLWQHQIEGWLSAWLMNGTTVIDGTLLVPAQVADPDWRIVGTGDLNAEGKTDLVWQHLALGYLATWHMDGITQIRGLELTPDRVVDTAWRIRAVGDLNQDSHADLVWQHATSGALAAWLMNGRTLVDGHPLIPGQAPAAEWTIAAPFARAQVAQPVLATPSGNYMAEFPLTATSVTPDAILRYTVDGSDPTTTSPVLTAYQVTEAATIRVRGFKDGMVPSRTTTGSYTFAAEAPVAGVATGTYFDTFTVALSTATTAATIRYTLDGSAPTEASPAYAAPVTVDRSLTLRARTFRANWTPSAESTGVYELQVGLPQLTPPPGTYNNDQAIGISVPSPGATIRYTLDGSEPTEASSVYVSPLVLAPQATTIVRARAYRSGRTTSPITGGSYTLAVVTAAPVATPAAGTYDIGQAVTLSTPEVSTIHYTLDGSEPTQQSSFYTSPIVLTQPTTIKAKGFRSGYAPMLLTAVYAIRVEAPTMTPAAGEYDPMPAINITGAAGVTLRYTTDRNEPTASSPIYTGPFVAGTDMTVKAQAYRDGWAPSRVVTQTYLSSVRDETGSPAVVTLGGATETGLSATGGTVSFLVSGAALSADPADAWVYRNGSRVPAAQVQVASNGVTIPGGLGEGRNDLELEAMDSNGYLVYDLRTVWAGSRVVTVTVRNAADQALAGATVTASLDEAGDVTASGASNGSGQAVLQRLPTTSVLHLRVEADGYR